MGWDEYHRRRATLAAVIEYAEKHPSAGLPYAQVPGVTEFFGSRRELLLALHYDWSQALLAQIELLSIDTRHGRLVDAATLARRAWLNAAARHPVLRRLLDDHLGEPIPANHDVLARIGSYVA